MTNWKGESVHSKCGSQSQRDETGQRSASQGTLKSKNQSSSWTVDKRLSCLEKPKGDEMRATRSRQHHPFRTHSASVCVCVRTHTHTLQTDNHRAQTHTELTVGTWRTLTVNSGSIELERSWISTNKQSHKTQQEKKTSGVNAEWRTDQTLRQHQ